MFAEENPVTTSIIIWLITFVCIYIAALSVIVANDGPCIFLHKDSFLYGFKEFVGQKG